MARSRYRSQPALQRSGGRGGVTLLVFSLAIVAAAGGGVLISLAMRGLDDWANTPKSRVEQAARNASAALPPAVASPFAAQGASGTEPEVQLAHATPPHSMARRPPKAVKPVKPLLADFGAPQRRWEQQQQAYQLARSAYDASERAEGFRWAQQYKVRGRYCRELGEQRTAAFMEGCLNYAAGARPRPPAGEGQENPG